jgi:hypothetical protein
LVYNREMALDDATRRSSKESRCSNHSHVSFNVEPEIFEVERFEVEAVEAPLGSGAGSLTDAGGAEDEESPQCDLKLLDAAQARRMRRSVAPHLGVSITVRLSIGGSSLWQRRKRAN